MYRRINVSNVLYVLYRSINVLNALYVYIPEKQCIQCTLCIVQENKCTQCTLSTVQENECTQRTLCTMQEDTGRVKFVEKLLDQYLEPYLIYLGNILYCTLHTVHCTLSSATFWKYSPKLLNYHNLRKVHVLLSVNYRGALDREQFLRIFLQVGIFSAFLHSINLHYSSNFHPF